jgi:peptidyl-prolyl cis-trans isomerase C
MNAHTRWLSVALLPLLANCEGKDAKAPSAAPGGKSEAVATIDGQTLVTVDQLEDQLREQSPFVRARYTDASKKKEFLDGLVRFELLGREAAKEGFDKDPEVVKDMKKAMVQQLLRKKFDEDPAVSKMSDEELKEFFEQHKDDYVKPERVRIQVIEFKGAPGDAKVQAEAKKDVLDVREKTKKGDLAAYSLLARTRSDDESTKLKGGDSDYKTREELAKSYGDGVANAALGLKEINDISEVVRGVDGWYVVRLSGRQNAINRTFDQVKPAIQARAWHEKRTKLYDAYVKELEDKSGVKIDEAALAKIDALRPDLGAKGEASVPPIQPTPPPPAGNLGMPPPGRVQGQMPSRGMGPPNGMPHMLVPSPQSPKQQ